MTVRLEDLPLRYQKQAKKQIEEQDRKQDRLNHLIIEDESENKSKPRKPEKYHSQRVSTYTGVSFRSKKEEKRYWELMDLLESGEISDLKLEPQFTLLEGYRKPDGSRVKRLHYTADFSYIEDGKLVVEDVKSAPTKTEAYGIRKTLMKDKYGIDIREIF